MSDSDDGFEIDLGEPTPAPVKPQIIEKPKPAQIPQKPIEVKPVVKQEIKHHNEQKKEESKDDYDDFEIEVHNNQPQPKAVEKPVEKMIPKKEPKEEFKQQTSQIKPEVHSQKQEEYILPIPPQEQLNSYFFMNQVPFILSENGTVTPLVNESQIYDKSAIWALYGPESKGFNFLVTGGMYAEKEDMEEDKYSKQEEIYHYHYGTSRTFTIRLMPKGSLQLKRFTNMIKLRFMHSIVNWWNGYNNRIFIIGGQSKTDVLSSTEYYDFKLNKWVSKASMNSPRSMLNVVNISEFIYVFGGFKDSQYFFAEPALERYSIENDIWEPIELESLQLSSKWGASMWRTYDNQILILGGYSTQASLDPNQQVGYQSLHKINPDNWSIEVMNSEGFWMPMSKFVTTNGVIFKSIGSISGFNALDFNLAENQWFESNSSWGLQNLMSDTKHGGQAIVNGLIYSSVLTHNFY